MKEVKKAVADKKQSTGGYYHEGSKESRSGQDRR